MNQSAHRDEAVSKTGFVTASPSNNGGWPKLSSLFRLAKAELEWIWRCLLPRSPKWVPPHHLHFPHDWYESLSQPGVLEECAHYQPCRCQPWVVVVIPPHYGSFGSCDHTGRSISIRYRNHRWDVLTRVHPRHKNCNLMTEGFVCQKYGKFCSNRFDLSQLETSLRFQNNFYRGVVSRKVGWVRQQQSKAALQTTISTSK